MFPLHHGPWTKSIRMTIDARKGEGHNSGETEFQSGKLRIDLRLSKAECRPARPVCVVLQAELNHFVNALHQSVEVLGLGVATAQGGNGGDVVLTFIPFDEHGERSRRLYEAILARLKSGPSPRGSRQSYPPSFSKNRQMDSIPR